MQEEGTSFEDARDQLRARGANRDAPGAEPVTPSGPARDEAPPEPGDAPAQEASRPPPRPAP